MGLCSSFSSASYHPRQLRPCYPWRLSPPPPMAGYRKPGSWLHASRKFCTEKCKTQGAPVFTLPMSQAQFWLTSKCCFCFAHLWTSNEFFNSSILFRTQNNWHCFHRKKCPKVSKYILRSKHRPTPSFQCFPPKFQSFPTPPPALPSRAPAVSRMLLQAVLPRCHSCWVRAVHQPSTLPQSNVPHGPNLPTGEWLSPTLWKMMDFVSWGIPNMEKYKIPWFQTTNQPTGEWNLRIPMAISWDLTMKKGINQALDPWKINSQWVELLGCPGKI